eukprot:c10055_g1_i2.p4 GENE.c10055_g1_i2~~c10055_g1_i2.p4  ORF type:complete len:120 (-),score=38.74 c10055_g1_i2:20-379(-)
MWRGHFDGVTNDLGHLVPIFATDFHRVVDVCVLADYLGLEQAIRKCEVILCSKLTVQTIPDLVNLLKSYRSTLPSLALAVRTFSTANFHLLSAETFEELSGLNEERTNECVCGDVNVLE